MAIDGIVVSLKSGRSADDVAILQVSGYLDTTTSGELEKALYDMLKRGQYKIVIDLSGITYISSAGWGIFIGEIKDIRNNGGDLKLAGMIGDVHEVFRLLEFQSILESYPDTESAVNAFGQPSRAD